MEEGSGIHAADDITIREDELVFQYIRAKGPGGQNVNKVATSVQLRFDVAHSSSLPEEVRERMMYLEHNRISAEGILVIEARRFRTQEQNRQDAIGRLQALIRRAAEKPLARRKTRPSRAAKARRLDEKRRRGEIKRLRGREDF